ncbi:MAG TPA: hypothetical protein VKD04_07760 [Burkholderiales bacterium]|nr:hypothetical protein [Burkholderiales bacterium]
MLRPEKIVVNTGLLLFVLAAVFEGLSRLFNRPDLHDVARWAAVAALFVALVPIALAGVVLGFQKLFKCKKGNDGSRAPEQPGRPVPRMSEPASPEPFYALAAALKESGYATHGRRLESILDGTWTTSSELIAELGQAVVSVRKECRPLGPAQKALVKDCLRRVRKVWPGFGWFSGLPFNR